MSRNDRTHLFGDATEDSSVVSLKRMTREEFGRRLYRMIKDMGLTQSEFARKAGLGRSLISSYVRGQNYPTPHSAAAMAKALGLKDPNELLPNHIAAAIELDTPAFEFRVSSADPKRGWIKIDRAVSIETGTKIMQILADDTSNRK